MAKRGREMGWETGRGGGATQQGAGGCVPLDATAQGLRIVSAGRFKGFSSACTASSVLVCTLLRFGCRSCAGASFCARHRGRLHM